jgi:glucose dehydrogenase
VLTALSLVAASAQVTHDRMLHVDREPLNWLTYGGSYSSQRYSLLNDITRENVGSLTLKWVWRR